MTGKTKKKTVVKVAKVAKEVPERVAERIIPLAALQCLAELSETLKKMRPKGGGAPAPIIILTSSGMELRLTGPEQTPGMPPERLASIEEELKALHKSTAALQEAVAKSSRAVEKTLESHSAAIGSVRAALSQNEELVEGIVETLQMLNGVSEDQSAEALAAAS